MSWGKLCDSMAFHPKVLKAGNEAVGAWMRMISYSCDKLTEGHVELAVAHSIAPPRVLKKAVDAGLLHRIHDGYVIHDFADYNPTGPEVLEKRQALRAKRAEAGKKGAMARWQKHSNGHGKQDGNAMASAIPEHGKPIANAWQASWQTDSPVSRIPIPQTKTAAVVDKTLGGLPSEPPYSVRSVSQTDLHKTGQVKAKAPFGAPVTGSMTGEAATAEATRQVADLLLKAEDWEREKTETKSKGVH